MANNVYIGMRYVPIFDGDWDNTKSYEALTIVTYGNNSYTSKKPVPVGTLPTDTTYWALTGNLNGMIIALQNDVGTLQGDMTTAQSDILALQTFDSSIRDSLNYPVHKVMLIMDSYGGRTNSDGKTVAQVLEDITGLDVDCIWQSGGAVYNGTITSLVNGYSGDGTVYDTVIYAAGANDEAYALSNWAAMPGAFASLATAINTKFPNAKNKFMACIGQTFKRDTTFTSEKNRYLLLAYRDFSRTNKFGYIWNSEYILRNDNFLEADLCHPNSNGINKLARYFADFLRTGHLDVNEYQAVTGVDMASRSYYYTMFRHNEVVVCRMMGAQCFIANAGSTSIALDGTYHDLVTFDHYLVNVDTTNSAMFCADSNNQIVYKNGSYTEIGECELFVKNGVLGGYLKTFGTTGIVGGFHVSGPSLVFNEY